jgi:transglutaminase-like putative cysteine protease
MTAFAVRHRTTYRYTRDVAYSRLVAHLAPRVTGRQLSQSFDLKITPAPVSNVERDDFFGNRTNWFTVSQRHLELEILAESRVVVTPSAGDGAQLGPSWESVRGALELPRDADALDAVQYAFDTPLTAVNPGLVAYARESFSRNRPLPACLIELNARIHADFTYDGDATDTSTTARRAFELRAGVCQDFAHVGIAAVRAMGLAARYVSGYLLTHPPPGQERLVGADASHAWFAAWIPSLGWVDFDPTNNVLPSSRHITVAWGRDFADVTPVHGIITGGSAHEVEVGVDVTPL